MPTASARTTKTPHFIKKFSFLGANPRPCVSYLQKQEMTREEIIDLLQRYEIGKCSQAEIEWVENWYQTLQEGSNETESSAIEARIWKRIEAKRSSSARKRIPQLAAAMALLVASAVLYFNYNSSNYNNKTAGRIVAVENTSAFPEWHRLPDGSRVKVWPKSKLSVEMNSAGRKVNLQGQAFFNVKHQTERPFFVVTSNLVAKVFRIIFLVNADGDKEFVSVKTGLVNISSPKSNIAVNISPNQQAVYNPGAMSLTATLAEKPQRFTSDKLYFEKAPVAEIFDELAKAYRLEINYDKKKLANCRLTSEAGSEDLFTVLKALCLAIDGSYSIKGTTIEIKSSGCRSEK